MIKVSIIVPVYKTEKFVHECIASVLEQTYCNIEILVIDDCGNDNSINIVSEYARKNDDEHKIRIIRHDRNRGLSVARNTGIQNAKGNYVFFLDSDDFLPNDAIENMVKMARKYPNSDVIYGTFNQYPYKWMTCIPDFNQTDLLEHYESNSIIKPLILDRNLLPEIANNKQIRIDFLKDNHLFFKEGIIHEDTLFTFYLAKYAKEIALVKEGSYYYRNNSSGIMASNNTIKHVVNNDIVIKECIKEINSVGLIKQLEFIIHLVHTNLILTQKISTDTPAVLKSLKILTYLLTMPVKRL